MRRLTLWGRLVPGSTAGLAALVIVLAAAQPTHAQQLFFDDFDSDWPYDATGVVDPSTDWVGGYNFGAGGPHDANITNPGNLTMGLDGVAWESPQTGTTGPMQYVEIDASQRFSAKVKISSQTAGFWSLAGIIARMPQDLGGDENFVQAASFRPNADDPNDALFQMTAPDGAAENEINFGASWDQLMWLRLDDLGGGEFKGYFSADGENWVLGGSRTNASLATGTRQVGLWGGAIGDLPDATVAFDSFEITLLPEPSTVVLAMAGITCAFGATRRRRP